MDNVRLCGPNNWREKSGRKPKQQDRPKRSKPSRPEWQKVVDYCLQSPAAPSIGISGSRALASDTLMLPQKDEDSTTDGVTQNYVHTSVRTTCFQERLSLILFLSYMSVLKTKTDTIASVFDCMKATLSLSLQTQFAQEMLNGLQNAHAVIRALEGKTDLALCQATEIFVAYGPYFPSHYRKMTSLCINYFSDQLGTKHESFVYSNNRIKMCIPYMVFRKYPGETLADIHHFLGYNTNCLTCNAKTSPTTTFETRWATSTTVGSVSGSARAVFPRNAQSRAHVETTSDRSDSSESLENNTPAQLSLTGLGRKRSGSPAFIPAKRISALETSPANVHDTAFLETIVDHSQPSSVVSRAIVAQEVTSPRYHLQPLPTASFVETVLRCVSTYFQRQCWSMRFDKKVAILTGNETEHSYDACNNFDSYCYTATIIAQQPESSQKFWHLLQKASELVKPILRSEHPRTLACFLEVLVHFIQTGFNELTREFCKYIQAMSVVILGKEHPFVSMFNLLALSNEEPIIGIMAQVWRCMTDVLMNELSLRCPLAVSARLDYIKRVFIANPQEEALLLQRLLVDIGDEPNVSTPRVALNIAHNLNRQGAYVEARRKAQDVIDMLQNDNVYTGTTNKQIECLKIIAHSYYNEREKQKEAYIVLQVALGTINSQLGSEHPWNGEFKALLQNWCQEWGWPQEANMVCKASSLAVPALLTSGLYVTSPFHFP